MSDDLLTAFVEEARELLEAAAQDLLQLERTPADAAALESLFRAIHTLKGSAGLIGFDPMAEAFHAGEDRLSELRRGGRSVDAALVETLLAALQQAEAWVEAIARRGQLPDAAGPEASALVRRISDLAAQQKAEPLPSADWADDLRRQFDDPSAALVAFRYTPARECYFTGDDPVAIVSAVPELALLRVTARTPFGDLTSYDPFACNLVLTGLSRASASAVSATFRFVSDQVEMAEPAPPAVAGSVPSAQAPAEPVATTAPEGRARALRVDAARVDMLAAAADDLVIAKNALTHLVTEAGRSASPALARRLVAAQADLERRVSTLHESIGRMRMAPLGTLFRRFPPIVRQVAGSLGKSVELSLGGEAVEVDKAIADGLHEPLLHLLRNAVDHGIEPVEARRAAGKPIPAALRLSAVAEGGDVVIELSDDGRGLDLARVRATASARGVASETELAQMSDAAVAELIFRPGFSTARAVTELSGRGVGLDAVRTALAALGGRVEVHSAPDAGARFLIRLPARVRLARLMTVEAGGETFGVPLESVVAATRIAPTRVTPVRAGQALVWRDRALPLLSLCNLLALPEPTPAQDVSEDLQIMVVRTGEEFAAVRVQSFGERLEAPLQPLTGVLSRVPGLLGSSLLGDGRVLMVLDVPELIG